MMDSRQAKRMMTGSIKRLIALCAAMVLAIGLPIGLVAASAQTPPQSYALGAGDKIRLITFGEDSLTGEFFVSGAGTVSLPLIGDVKAAGLTTSQLEAEIANDLRAGYLKDPRVSVEVLNYRPFYILGEVNKPGEYPYENGLTVLNAVAAAAGFTYRADAHRVFIKHAGETTEHEYRVAPSLTVEPGDTVRVKERFF